MKAATSPAKPSVLQAMPPTHHIAFPAFCYYGGDCEVWSLWLFCPQTPPPLQNAQTLDYELTIRRLLKLEKQNIGLNSSIKTHNVYLIKFSGMGSIVQKSRGVVIRMASSVMLSTYRWGGLHPARLSSDQAERSLGTYGINISLPGIKQQCMTSTERGFKETMRVQLL